MVGSLAQGRAFPKGRSVSSRPAGKVDCGSVFFQDRERGNDCTEHDPVMR